MLAQGYGYGYGYSPMKTVSLKLNHEEALHLSHAISDRLGVLSLSIGIAVSEDRKDDAMRIARAAGHLQRVQDNLGALARQVIIGW